MRRPAQYWLIFSPVPIETVPEVSRFSIIVRVNIVLNRTVIDSCITSVNGIKNSGFDLIGQLSRDVIGRLLVKP